LNDYPWQISLYLRSKFIVFFHIDKTKNQIFANKEHKLNVVIDFYYTNALQTGKNVEQHCSIHFSLSVDLVLLNKAEMVLYET